MTTPRKTPWWVPYVGIFLTSFLVTPFAMDSSLADWPFLMRMAFGATLGIVSGAVSRALWQINNGGRR